MAQLLIFHYSHEGTATAVKSLPPVEKRTESVFDLQTRAPRALMEDSAGSHKKVDPPGAWVRARPKGVAG